MEIASDDYLLLSTQRALLTHVTQALRSVSVEADAIRKIVFVRFIFEREPSESDRDAASCAGTEIIADYPATWTIEEEFIVCPTHISMEHRKLVAYHRCEDERVSPTA